MTERMDTCGICRFYKASVDPTIRGQCRRRAPQAIVVDFTQQLTMQSPVWPYIWGDDWCGEFELQRSRG